MSKKDTRIIWIVVGLLVVGGGAVAYQQQQGKEKPAATVTVETAARRQLVATVSAEGRIDPVTQVKLSAEIPGRITKLAVKEGDVVKQGDFLVELDPEMYITALDATKSALKSAQASKLKADSDYRRVSELVSRGMSSQADMDAMLAQSQLAEADLERAQAEERRARENMARRGCRPRCPARCRR